MSPTWIVVLVSGAVTIAEKGLGAVAVGGRGLPPRLEGVVALLAPAVLAALVVTQAVGGDGELVLDARLVGLGAAALALAVRAPLVVVIGVAAAATAFVRLF